MAETVPYVPQPQDVVSWPQALVAVVLIIVVVALPQILQLVQTRRLNRTLTKNNGGSSVKDQRDSIAADAAATRELVEERLVPAVDDLTSRVTALETPTPRGIFGRLK